MQCNEICSAKLMITLQIFPFNAFPLLNRGEIWYDAFASSFQAYSILLELDDKSQSDVQIFCSGSAWCNRLPKMLYNDCNYRNTLRRHLDRNCFYWDMRRTTPAPKLMSGKKKSDKWPINNQSNHQPLDKDYHVAHWHWQALQSRSWNN